MKTKALWVGILTLGGMLAPYVIANSKVSVQASNEPLATCNVINQKAREYEDPEFAYRYTGAKVYSCEGDLLKARGAVSPQPARLIVAPVVVVHYVGSRPKIFVPVELYDGTRGLVDQSLLRPLDEDRA